MGNDTTDYSDDQQQITNCLTFCLMFDVYFTSFDAFDYPMAITTDTNALQIHGLGPCYGRDKGHLSAYIYMDNSSCAAIGPHGRGITGCTGQGWLRSRQQLEANRWHSVTFLKRETSLSMIVDGVEVNSPYTYQTPSFVMKPAGNLLVGYNGGRCDPVNGPVRVRNLQIANGASTIEGLFNL